MFRPLALACALLLSLSLWLTAAPAISSQSLAGHWRLETETNPDLGGWSDIKINIAIDGDKVVITREFGAGKRTFSETINIDTSRAETVVPVKFWPDHRSIAAAIGGDKNKRVHATWIDGRRILRLSSDIILETQQGERPVNVLSDYKLSADGNTMTLVEIRSTRARPVVCVFKRA